MPGVVYLVGAGPGDPGLITAKGADLLRRADIVVYDRLVSSDLLALAARAELVYVGKEPSTPSSFQEHINNSLAAAAMQGKTVVRLKGGDPFVFGRGGEEALALAEAGVPFEIVPGVTSAIAVPAYSGVPVTHRGVAAAFTVVTGSEDPSKPESALDWQALARSPGTLVVLMGWRSLPAIVDALIAAGRSPETPVSATQWGTSPQQQTVDGVLADIVAKGVAAGFTSPVVTVIGDVAQLRPALRWRRDAPLAGKRILVTRARAQASVLSALLAEQGAEPIELPAIEIRPLKNHAELDAALRRLTNANPNGTSQSAFDWVVFTSVNAVEVVFDRLAASGKDARAFAGADVAAIGPATAAALQSRGIAPDMMPRSYTTSAIVDAFSARGIDSARILLPRADIAPPALADGLRSLGAELVEVVAYHTVAPANAPQLASETLAAATIDAITFTSSSTVRNLVRLLDGDPSPINARSVISIGPATSATARELGVRVDIEAAEHTVKGVVAATLELFENEAAP